MPVLLSAFILKEDVLCRIGTVAKTQVTQVVIPSSLVGTVLKLLHDTPQASHLGRDRALSMACAKYYWPTMRLDIEKHIAQCLSCADTKGTTQTAPILEHPLPARPFDVVGIDILQLPRSIQGSIYVLVYVDHFSRFTVLAPYVTSLLLQWLMPMFLISSAPTRLLVFSSMTMGQNLRIRSFGISALNFTFNRHLLHHITLLQTASLNVPTGKSLRFCATLQEIYRKHERTGFLTLLPLFTALSILPQAKRLTTFCMDLRNTYLTMCLFPLLFPCTPQMIIINCSLTASKLSTTLFGRNLKLHVRRCFANSTLRLPQFILISVTLS